ncbi:MAG: hypothetical protein EOO01_23475, partial [Chitinophagaceae bacterium]
MRTFLLLIVAMLIIALPACKKSKGTMSDMRETEKMAIMPEPAVMETILPEETKNAEMERLLAALESSFKVDAILSIYAGQHSASSAIKRFARSLAKESA